MLKKLSSNLTEGQSFHRGLARRAIKRGKQATKGSYERQFHSDVARRQRRISQTFNK